MARNPRSPQRPFAVESLEGRSLMSILPYAPASDLDPSARFVATEPNSAIVSGNNLKQIGIALHGYTAVAGFPGR